MRRKRAARRLIRSSPVISGGWDARYPDGAVATGDIHIPAQRRLLVRIESTDVIHDFWASELARKVDAVPGQPSYISLEADAAGTYLGACSEFCRAQHAVSRDRTPGGESHRV